MNANPYSGVKVNTDKTVLGLNIFERYYFRLASNSNSFIFKLVADTDYGFNKGRIGCIWFDFFSQSSNMGIDYALVAEATRLQNRA